MQWLRDGLGIIKQASETGPLADEPGELQHFTPTTEALVVPDITNPFFGRVLRGAQRGGDDDRAIAAIPKGDVAPLAARQSGRRPQQRPPAARSAVVPHDRSGRGLAVAEREELLDGLRAEDAFELANFRRVLRVYARDVHSIA